MKKLQSLLFYALLTPAIALSSGALLAAESSSEEPDLGEQSMGHDAAPETQSPEQDKEVTKSRYNSDDQPTDAEKDDRELKADRKADELQSAPDKVSDKQNPEK